ncbi:MAG: sortase [Erythrobacter sp.]|uniref:sortase domain-containing protein n=1 Tax=Erythrobacter sp. TaxID=1042 RepID=UPI0032669C7E
MSTVSAHFPDIHEERAHKKGAFARALPLLVIASLLLSGAAVTAKALYIPIKAEVAQLLLNRAFNASVDSGSPVKPWSWADTAPIARITMPRLGKSDVVLSGGSGEAMAFGPTALIDDKFRALTILAAHKDTHFEYVKDLRTGDRLTLQRVDGSRAMFRITHFETVRWDEFTHPTQGNSYGDGGLVMLTTCFPFGTSTPGSLRRIVWAELVEDA